MTDTTEITIDESSINAVTFTHPDSYFGTRTYIEMSPGHWRSLYDVGCDILSDSLDFDAAVTEYFKIRFSGEDLPEHPGSGNGDGTGTGDGGGKGDSDGGGEPGPGGGGL